MSNTLRVRIVVSASLVPEFTCGISFMRFDCCAVDVNSMSSAYFYFLLVYMIFPDGLLDELLCCFTNVIPRDCYV